MILGITGTSGAGKGVVSKILEKHGFFHIDTDILSREVIPRTLPKLIETFGKITDENGDLDRKKLAEKAFSSKEETKKLNKILHGEILLRVDEIIAEKLSDGKTDFTIDGAALFEAGADKKCDYVISVLCDEAIRLERVVVRDKITRAYAKTRFAAQLPDEFFIKNSDFVINNTNLDKTEEEVLKILEKIKSK